MTDYGDEIYKTLTPLYKEIMINLTNEKIQSLKSMAIYWKEVSKREVNTDHIFAEELSGVIRSIGSKNILLIINEYLKHIEVNKS